MHLARWSLGALSQDQEAHTTHAPAALQTDSPSRLDNDWGLPGSLVVWAPLNQATPPHTPPGAHSRAIQTWPFPSALTALQEIKPSHVKRRVMFPREVQAANCAL